MTQTATRPMRPSPSSIPWPTAGLRRLAVALVLAVAIAVSGLPMGFVGGASTAEAQERSRPNLLDVLRGNKRRAAPSRKRAKPRRATRKRATKRRANRKVRRNAARRAKPRTVRRKAVTRKKAAGVATAAAPALEPVEKIDNAKVVLVIGDFLAAALADGLSEAFVELPGVRVVEATEGSSGLVRDDYHDWPETVPGLIETHKPAVVVVQLGANDRQAIKEEAGAVDPGTEAWSAAYRERVREMVRTVTGAGVPLVWVGAPSFRQRSLNANMVTLNGVFEDVATTTGGSFVDVWDGFVDQNGAYVRSGPDVNGQAARLRAKDGINFTRAGKRKMAFFAERDVRRLLGGAVAVGAGTLTATNLAPLGDDLLEAPLQPLSTPPLAIGDGSLDGGTVLLGGDVAEAAPAGPRTNPGLLPDVDGGPPEGRADNFAWPAAAEAPAS